MESLIKDLLRYNKTPCSASRPRSLAAVEGCSSACVWLLLRSCGITRRSSVNRVARFRTLRTQGLSWTRGQKAGALLPQRHGQVDNRNRVRRSPYSILSRSSCVVRMACTPSFWNMSPLGVLAYACQPLKKQKCYARRKNHFSDGCGVVVVAFVANHAQAGRILIRGFLFNLGDKAILADG